MGDSVVLTTLESELCEACNDALSTELVELGWAEIVVEEVVEAGARLEDELLEAPVEELLVDDARLDDAVELTPSDVVVLIALDVLVDTTVAESVAEDMFGEENTLLALGLIELELDEGAEEPLLVVLDNTAVDEESADDVVAAALLVLLKLEPVSDKTAMVVLAELVKVLLGEFIVNKELTEPKLICDVDEMVEE